MTQAHIVEYKGTPSCGYVSLHKPLHHTHKTGNEDGVLGEGRPKLLSGAAPFERRPKAHIWTRMCFHTMLSVCGQTKKPL